MKRATLKYCGGCDPAYERVEYAERIRAAAGERIEWVPADAADCRALLVVCGCPTACFEVERYIEDDWRVTVVADDRRAPAEIVDLLLSEGGER